jgi:hypothetical protein
MQCNIPASCGVGLTDPRFMRGLTMANVEGPEGQPPAAWVWSQYRGVTPAQTPSDEAHSDSPGETAPAAKNTGAIGLGLAAAVLVIAGLTWLFTTKPASEPAASQIPAPTTETPAAHHESGAAPAAEQEAPKPAEPAPAHQHAAKKKKHK